MRQLRNSERTDFRRCPQRWHWRYGEHLVPIQFSTGPLVFGTFGHLALAEHYIPGSKRGANPVETWDKLTKDYIDACKSELTNYIDDDVEMTWVDARSLGHDMLVNYLEFYGNDPQWDVLWTEQPFRQNVPNPRDLAKAAAAKAEGRPAPAIRAIRQYVGTLDLIVRDHDANGRIRYVDHKFMKAITVNHLSIDSQNGGYLAVGTHQLRQLGLLGPKEAVRDLVYNFLRKSRYPDKPRNEFGEWLNKDGTPMKRQPSAFFLRHVVTKTAAERNSQIYHIGDEAIAMDAFLTGKLNLYKNPTRDCSWDCSFFTLCQVHESGGNHEEVKRAMFRKEDPYGEYAENAVSPKRLGED